MNGMETGVKPSTLKRWWMLILALAAWCVVYISYLGYSSDTGTMMELFGLDYTQLGALASYPALINGILSLFLGILINRWGNKKVILTGVLLCTVSEIVWALAPSYAVLMIARCISGVGQPFVFVSTMCIAMEWFENSKDMPIAMGVFNAGDGLGSLFGLYAFAFILVTFGYRKGSLIGAGIMFAVFLLCLFALKDAPIARTSAESENGSSGKELIRQFVGCYKKINVVMATIISCGLWAAYSIAVYWIPTILVEDAGYSQTFAGLMGTLYPFSGIVGGMIVSVIATNSGKRKIFVWAGGLLSSICCLLMPIAYQNQAWMLLNILFLAAGFFVYAEFPIALTLVAETVESDLLGTANGVVSGVGAVIGGTVFPLLIGAIKDMTSSYSIGFTVLGISCLVMLFVPGLFVKEKVKS